jgi:hypothetical protein
MVDEIIKVAGVSLNMALEAAANEPQPPNRVFSPQNWIKTKGCLAGIITIGAGNHILPFRRQIGTRRCGICPVPLSLGRHRQSLALILRSHKVASRRMTSARSGAPSSFETALQVVPCLLKQATARDPVQLNRITL